MPGVEKILEKMHNQPNGIKLSEVEKVLLDHGYSFIRQKGSHSHYIHRDIGDMITVRQENPLKNVYILLMCSTESGSEECEMTVEEYMALPYTRLIQEINDESGHYYYGCILELDGCQSTADTIDSLMDSLNEAMEGYLEIKVEMNLPIPMPLQDDGYSGRFVVRLPKSLHKKLSIEASNEGVSLNQWVCHKLAL